jgi:uncharacterized protein YdhG (YjbR/CyaY superfamily)
VKKTRAASNQEASARVRAYLASLPVDVRRVVRRIRQDIRAAAPRATEVFSYGVPGFRFEGTIRFPLSKTLSSSLVKRLVKGRLAEMR